MPLMSSVIPDGMPGQQSPHHCGDRNRAGFQQEMKVIWKQCPRIARRFGLFQDQAKILDKVRTVLFVIKYPATLDTSGHNVMQSPCCVNT